MSDARVDLFWLGGSAPAPWPLGDAFVVEPGPDAVRERIDAYLATEGAAYCLFWDSALGAPDVHRVARTLERPGDLWHAGLRLGMAGLPRILDFVTPTWMLHCDPETTCEATSWRLSLRACLLRASLLRRLGGPAAGFRTLAAASCEMGHRYVKRGAILRHVPDLLSAGPPEPDVDLPFEDELRFVALRFGSFWTRWALARALLTRYVSLRGAGRAWRAARSFSRAPDPPPYRERPDSTDERVDGPADGHDSVSVLIPTLERYDYLRSLLAQLRRQTVPPLEIIVVDQTARERRDETLRKAYADLPLRWIERDEPGQCSSRNAGLQIARGEYVLFLDDDDEIPPDLIEAHLASLRRHGASVSSGVAEESGAGSLPGEFRLFRVSDVFPTNNTLARLDTFTRSGLFDLAYERGSRADGDLGMRVYRSGALMVLSPDVAVIHHHAPTGGLRAHKARVITYASSRRRLLHRHLPSPTEIYLATRYFGPRRAREMLWQTGLATLSLHGPSWARMLKGAVGLLLLPDTLWRIRRAHRDASRLGDRFPVIPAFTPREDA